MSISLLILLPLLGALLNGGYALWVAARKSKPSVGLVSFIGVSLPFLAFCWALKLGWPLLQGHEEHVVPLTENLFTWMTVGNFQVSGSFLLDRLSLLMVLIVTGVGSMIHLYSVGYMKEDAGFARYFAYLNLFLASMLILVLADNLLLLFVGWEGVGLCSYLLIGFWFDDAVKAYAGKKAFVVNRIGDFGFLIGIFILIMLLSSQAGPSESILNFNYIQSHTAFIAGSASLITLFLFIGATGKSAQIPLYVWLPDAMAGPTPVSALIHAATMVTAGVYMIARLHFLFDMAPTTLHIIAVIGAVTAIFSASIGLVQNDIKKILAYSTVSQLGFMFLAVGVGAYTAGVFHLMTHAFFKACLFLGSGSVIHALSGEQDIRKMGGLRKALPWTFLTFLIATIAIAGIPPFAGFFSKDEILWQVYGRGNKMLYFIGFIAAGFTSFYMFRLVCLTFFGESRLSEKVKHHLHESPISMTSVLVLLALLSIVGGWVGIPHALGGHNLIHEWLGIETAHSLEGAHYPLLSQVGLERLLAGGSTLWAIGWALLAVLFYLKFPVVPRILAEKLRPIYVLLQNKYYVDEIYNFGVVQPIRWISDKILAKVVDQGLIDGLVVNGAGRIASFFGGVVNRFQNGLANAYAFYFLIALGGFLFFWVIR